MGRDNAINKAREEHNAGILTVKGAVRQLAEHCSVPPIGRANGSVASPRRGATVVTGYLETPPTRSGRHIYV